MVGDLLAQRPMSVREGWIVPAVDRDTKLSHISTDQFLVWMSINMVEAALE